MLDLVGRAVLEGYMNISYLISVVSRDKRDLVCLVETLYDSTLPSPVHFSILKNPQTYSLFWKDLKFVCLKNNGRTSDSKAGTLCTLKALPWWHFDTIHSFPPSFEFNIFFNFKGNKRPPCCFVFRDILLLILITLVGDDDTLFVISVASDMAD